MFLSGSSLALAAALLCLTSPYVASLLSHLSLFQRAAAALAIYIAISAQLQHQSASRFKVAPSSSSSPSIPPSSDGPSKHKPSPSVSRSPSRTASLTKNLSEDDSIANRVVQIRTSDCPPLLDACYLDSAAAPPFPTTLLHSVSSSLSSQPFSNPHSKSPSALSTADLICSVRSRVMRELFGVVDTHNYHLVFTSGTTASLKLVGESLDWSAVGGFKFLRESHTSVVGIRDLASKAGVEGRSFAAGDDVAEVAGEGLVVLPLQCNATGRRYGELMKKMGRKKGRRGVVMVDAASYLSSSTRLDFSQLKEEEKPDMVAFSFYKIFGYPTGLGGLLVKSSVAPLLSKKVYFGGGTVDSILAEDRWTKPKKDFESRFEDGTVNFHGIVAVNKALDYYSQTFGSWEGRAEYVAKLTESLRGAMEGLVHGNGQKVVRIYGGGKNGGPIVNFNLLTPTGSVVPPQEVDRLASVSNIHLRMGRHCNPGFVTSQLHVSPSQLQQEYAEGVGCDDAGGDSGNVVSASLRASLCLLNTEEDIERLVGFVARFFLSPSPFPSPSPLGSSKVGQKEGKFKLSGLTVYPIKSCAGQELSEGQEWELTRHGLEYDREWIVMNLASGKGLSQKRLPRMALIRPVIDLASRSMTVTISGTDRRITLSLDDESQYHPSPSTTAAEVCGQEVRPRAHKSEHLRLMLTDLLGVSCTLARQASDVSRHSKLNSGGDKVPLIFSNESPFLLINSASVQHVGEWAQQDLSPAPSLGDEGASDSGYSSTSHIPLPPKQGKEVQAASFRANFLITPTDGGSAFDEDAISRVVLGKQVFGVLGECRRCQMVCVDQETGEVKPQTLRTLAKWRRNARGRIIFGSHLSWCPDLSPREEKGSKVWVGMDVVTS